MPDDGVTRSAVLLMSIGEEAAAEVLKFLAPKEVQRISEAMAKLTGVSREQMAVALSEFRKEAEQQTNIGTQSKEFIRTVLNKALGADKAAALIDRILEGNENSGIESLKWMDAQTIGEMIRNEHPQVIATILVHLDRDHASDVLKQFNERLRNETMIRIASLEGVQPAAMRELNDVLTELMSGSDKIKRTNLGGIEAAADILNYLGASVETVVLGSIRDVDAELAQKIQDKMFVFENILEIDDRGIQLLMREVQSESLIIALKGTSNDLREKIFKNMSQRAAEMLREDLEAKGAVKLSDVEAEQKEILKIVRRLADEGQIILGGKGGEESLVE